MSDRTATSIANMAADFLDIDPIGHIDEDYGAAQTFKRNYEESVETVTAEFPWNCATARAKLNPLSIEDSLRHATDFQNAYAWPSDCIRPNDINGRPVEDLHWDNETIALVDQHGNVVGRQRVLWCDEEGAIYLRYNCIIKPRDMSAHMAKAVALELAIRCCTKLTNSTSKSQELKVDYAEATRGSARRVGGYQVDSRSNRPKPRRVLPSTGARARAGGI